MAGTWQITAWSTNMVMRKVEGDEWTKRCVLPSSHLPSSHHSITHFLQEQEPMCLVVLILSTHRRRNCLRETLLDESQVLVMSKYCHSHEVQVGPPGGTNGLDWQINRAISVLLNSCPNHTTCKSWTFCKPSWKMTHSEQKAPQPEDRPGCPPGSEFLMIIVARNTCDTWVVMRWFVDINKPIAIMVMMMMMIL